MCEFENGSIKRNPSIRKVSDAKLERIGGVFFRVERRDLKEAQKYIGYGSKELFEKNKEIITLIKNRYNSNENIKNYFDDHEDLKDIVTKCGVEAHIIGNEKTMAILNEIKNESADIFSSEREGGFDDIINNKSLPEELKIIILDVLSTNHTAKGIFVALHCKFLCIPTEIIGMIDDDFDVYFKGGALNELISGNNFILLGILKNVKSINRRGFPHLASAIRRLKVKYNHKFDSDNSPFISATKGKASSYQNDFFHVSNGIHTDSINGLIDAEMYDKGNVVLRLKIHKEKVSTNITNFKEGEFLIHKKIDPSEIAGIAIFHTGMLFVIDRTDEITRVLQGEQAVNEFKRWGGSWDGGSIGHCDVLSDFLD